VIEIDKGVSRPEAISQFVAGDDFAGLFQKDREDLERLFGKLKSQPVLAQFANLQIYFEDAETKNPCGSGRGAHEP
jgi:hypothetical protein